MKTEEDTKMVDMSVIVWSWEAGDHWVAIAPTLDVICRASTQGELKSAFTGALNEAMAKLVRSNQCGEILQAMGWELREDKIQDGYKFHPPQLFETCMRIKLEYLIPDNH